MTPEELKIRQMTNQYLTASADKMTVVRDLCGLQAQLVANALHALRIRCNDFQQETVEFGLVKNWSVRGTVHIFAELDLPLFIHCDNGDSYRKNDWHDPSFWNQRGKWALTPERQAMFSSVILAAVSEKTHTRDELKALCRANGMTAEEESSMFDSWGGGIRELCERGFMHGTVEEKRVYTASPIFCPIPEEEAMLEIARRYFTNMGPATIHDAMYYMGVTQARVKRWLQQLPVESIACNGRTYYFIPNGKSYDCEYPSCIFLAGFDPLMLAYQKKESLYLPQEHLRGIFNLAGMVMPSVLLRGRVVGRWKKKGKHLTVTLFESVCSKDQSLMRDAADRLWSDLDGVTFE